MKKNTQNGILIVSMFIVLAILFGPNFMQKTKTETITVAPTQTAIPTTATATAMPTRTAIPPTSTRTPLPSCAIHPMPPEATINGPALVYLMGFYGGKTQVIEHFVKAGESIIPISGTNVDYCASTGPNNLSLIRRLEIIKE